MIDEIADALRDCRSERDFWRVQLRAESILTPLEIAALIEFSHRLPLRTQEWLKRIASLGEFGDAEPQRFCRQPLAPNIDVYRDPFVASDHKRLILGFCGGADRLMMPIACVLQYLPSDLCDLVVLRDPTWQHYLKGIPPYAHSLPDLVRRIAADIGAETYWRIYCYGASMGAFSALRCGILQKAHGAISLGGRFHWQPLRPRYKSDRMLPAFDPLCDCNSGTTTELFCVYAAENARDVENAKHLSRILPVKHIAISDTSEHNVIVALWTKGELKAFYDRMFALHEPGDKPMQRDIATDHQCLIA
jgi:hypothetical protein